MSRYVNEHELRVIGMSRSGNHAVINWITNQVRGRACFLNCTEGKHNPFHTARPMEDGRSYETNDPSFDLASEQQGRLSPKDYLIFSHEDSFLANACSEIFEQQHDAWVGPSRRRYDVLVLRDPFNLFASRRWAGVDEVSPATALRIWKQHAREFLGKTRRLRHRRVLISYNHWFADREYRRAIAGQLGLCFTDQGLERVACCNGGSSFDGLRYDGRAGQMKVLERWRYFASIPEFWGLFDRQTLRLSRQIFGPAPHIEAMLEQNAFAGEPVF